MDPDKVHLDSEYQAQLAVGRRDYGAALEYTVLARDTAIVNGDSWAYCRLTIEVARCQYNLGLMDACIGTLEPLVDSDAIADYPDSAALARALLSGALLTKGDMAGALSVAEGASQSVTGQSREMRLALQHSLVSALAEEGEIEAAWREALLLDSLIGPESGARERGNAFWTIGNTAFVSGRIDEGREYHRRAGEALGALNDVNHWALFNKASANLRLEAGLIEPATLDCVERAEVAISVAEGNFADRLEIRLTRAHWEHLSGNSTEAEPRLREIAASAKDLFPYTSAQALQLLAECLLAQGREGEALKAAYECERIFRGLGAVVRESQATNLIGIILSKKPGE